MTGAPSDVPPSVTASSSSMRVWMMRPAGAAPVTANAKVGAVAAAPAEKITPLWNRLSGLVSDGVVASRTVKLIRFTLDCTPMPGLQVYLCEVSYAYGTAPPGGAACFI